MMFFSERISYIGLQAHNSTTAIVSCCTLVLHCCTRQVLTLWQMNLWIPVIFVKSTTLHCWDPCIFYRRTNSLEFTAWSSARSSCWLDQDNLGGTWRRIRSPDVRSVSALEVSCNRALQIDIYLLTYLLTSRLMVQCTTQCGSLRRCTPLLHDGC